MAPPTGPEGSSGNATNETAFATPPSAPAEPKTCGPQVDGYPPCYGAIHGTCNEEDGLCYCEPYYGERDLDQPLPSYDKNGKLWHTSTEIGMVGVDNTTFCRQRQCEDSTCTNHGSCVHVNIDIAYCACDLCYGGMDCEVYVERKIWWRQFSECSSEDVVTAAPFATPSTPQPPPESEKCEWPEPRRDCGLAALSVCSSPLAADGESADQSLLVTSRRVLGLTEAAHNMTALEETGMQNEAVAAFASLFKASSGSADADNPDADYPYPPVAPPPPPPPAMGALGGNCSRYDAAGNYLGGEQTTVLVLVGGNAASDKKDANNGADNGVWLYWADQAKWERLQQADRNDHRGGAYYSRNHFEPRYGHSVTPYHSHTSEPKAMIFGGYGVTHKGRDVSYFLSDMWTVDIMGRSVYRVFPAVYEYPGTAYAPPGKPEPGARMSHAVTSTACYMYVFGGMVMRFSGDQYSNEAARIAYYDDLWEYLFPAPQSGNSGCHDHDPDAKQSGRWRRISTISLHPPMPPTANAPPPAPPPFDCNAYNNCPETANLGTGQQYPLAPQARSGAAMVVREIDDQHVLLLFGGYDGMVELDDMWSLTLLYNGSIGGRWEDRGYGGIRATTTYGELRRRRVEPRDADADDRLDVRARAARLVRLGADDAVQLVLRVGRRGRRADVHDGVGVRLLDQRVAHAAAAARVARAGGALVAVLRHHRRQRGLCLRRRPARLRQPRAARPRPQRPVGVQLDVPGDAARAPAAQRREVEPEPARRGDERAVRAPAGVFDE